MKNLVEELQWRGLVQDMIPGTEEQLLKEATTVYIGFDPTADSLHIGSLVPIIILKHLRNFGHRPIALVGGATGMIGDPSGKSDERNLLDEATLDKNVAGIRVLLSNFLDFDAKDANAPILVNNYDWMKDFSFINFARDVGKRITVNYMMSKDSVKKRFSGDAGDGMSFTEFTYQLIQGYDFYHLNKEYNCLLQMGGSDQWGNITTGTELVRRMNVDNAEKGKAFAMTCPLITKADGSKFGKSEGGNVWLTADKTSPYKFYQFWLNTSDVDAEKYIKIFTFLDKETIETIVAEHTESPHLRVLQKRLADELMLLVHSKEDLDGAIFASGAFFSKDMTDLKTLNENQLAEIFEGIQQAEVSLNDIKEGIDIVTLLNEKTAFLASNGEARRALKENSISVNKEKVTEDFVLKADDLIGNKFVLLQRGKKNYFVLKVHSKKLINPIEKREKISTRKTLYKNNHNKGYRLKVISFINEDKYRKIYEDDNFVLFPDNTLFKGSRARSQNVNMQLKTSAGLGVSVRVIKEFHSREGTLPLTKSAMRRLSLKKNDEVDVRLRKNGEIFIVKAELK